jgi:hypothetical protein
MQFVHVLTVAHLARQWVTKRGTNFANLQITILRTYHYGLCITGLTPGLVQFFRAGNASFHGPFGQGNV